MIKVFNTIERARIAKILGVEIDSIYIEEISHRVAEARASRVIDRRTLIEYRKSSFVVPRGRPFVGDSTILLAYFLAHCYVDCTGKPVTVYRGGGFYELLKFCLRQSDPVRFVRKIKGPPFNFTAEKLIAEHRVASIRFKQQASRAWAQGWAAGWLLDK